MADRYRASARIAGKNLANTTFPATTKNRDQQARTAFRAQQDPDTSENENDDVGANNATLQQLTPPESVEGNTSSPGPDESPEQPSSDEDAADSSEPEEDGDAESEAESQDSEATLAVHDEQSEESDDDDDSQSAADDEASEASNSEASDDDEEEEGPDFVDFSTMTAEEYEACPIFQAPHAPFPKYKTICQKIMSHFIPKNGVVALKAVEGADGKVKPALEDNISEEDFAKLHDLYSILQASRSFYKCLGGQAFRFLNFEFIKTTALKGVMTGYREWETNDGLPTLLGLIKTVTIHKSFKQSFGDWLSDLVLLEYDKVKDIKELVGLREIVFTEMPAGKDVEKTGTCYMPSALEKLRALQNKLKDRKMGQWIVEEKGLEQEWVTVRLIHDKDVDDEKYGVREGVSDQDLQYSLQSY